MKRIVQEISVEGKIKNVRILGKKKGSVEIIYKSEQETIRQIIGGAEGYRVISATENLSNDVVTIIQEKRESKEKKKVEKRKAEAKAMDWKKRYFPIVNVKGLDMSRIIDYVPRSREESIFRYEVIQAFKLGVRNFRLQRMDPSVNKEGKIYYKEGASPALDLSAYWWHENARYLLQRDGSRLISEPERVMFLAVVKNRLVDELNYEENRAWYEICTNSINLGIYQNTEECDGKPGVTGQKQILDWCDLANTKKIIVKENFEYKVGGGSFKEESSTSPLAKKRGIENPFQLVRNSTGQIVLPL